jgi:hypothetical protein
MSREYSMYTPPVEKLNILGIGCDNMEDNLPVVFKVVKGQWLVATAMPGTVVTIPKGTFFVTEDGKWKKDDSLRGKETPDYDFIWKPLEKEKNRDFER